MERKNMKKGIIVVNMPSKCGECDFYGIVCGITGRSCNAYFQDGRADSCPIHELPQRKEPTRMLFSPMLPWQHTEYEQGWNDCLKEINQEIDL